MDMNGRVLITGGSGLIGRRLTDLLLEKGHEVAWLSRGAAESHRVPRPHAVRVFRWDVERGDIEHDAVEWADAVVHLAGAGVADRRWTARRKRTILDSRVHATRLLRKSIQGATRRPEVVIAASATGRYGSGGEDRWMSENDDPDECDFLAEVVRQWEAESAVIANTGVRSLVVRIGIVLSRDGGALPRMAAPFRLGLGAPIGTGEQYMSWIHIDDLCRMIVHALDDATRQGVYNGVAPHPVTNAVFSDELARAMGRPFFMPAVPAFVLRMVMGEMASIVLGGARVSSRKAQHDGFTFRYPTVRDALNELFRNGSR